MQETIKRVMATALSVGAIAGAVSEAPAARGEDAPATVTCRVRDDARGRVFVLRQAGSRARPAERPSRAGSSRCATGNQRSVDRPRAAGSHAGDHPHEREALVPQRERRTAGGPRRVCGGGASLDVWVDHGLDVNIEPDLDPRVDRLNTHGPITALQCAIDVGAAAPRD